VPTFAHHDLRLLSPAYESPLIDVLQDLDYLRRQHLRGTTPLPVFLQLKRIFHLLESLASARIEGNRTTLLELVDAEQAPTEQLPLPGAQMLEIRNIDGAMTFIEDTVRPGEPITEQLLRHLHELTVRGLQPAEEGDRTPGAYRGGPVRIAQAQHLPPTHLGVPDYMAKLIAFINQEDPRKYDLMKVALAHHRFAWIHPFHNGNGRVVRLLTYAMLLKYGFIVNVAPGEQGRLLNPAAVFCADRMRYYDMLATADSGTDVGLEAWTVFVLTGLRDEMRKVAQLADNEYLRVNVLRPAVLHAVDRQTLTPMEAEILLKTMGQGEVKSADFADLMRGMTDNQRTYQLRRLVERGMLQPVEPNARRYVIGFAKGALLPAVIRMLTEAGFVSDALSGGIAEAR
jgi:Fic family protein